MTKLDANDSLNDDTFKGAPQGPPADLAEDIPEDVWNRVANSLAVISCLRYLVVGLILPCRPKLVAAAGVPASMYGLTVFTLPTARLLSTFPIVFSSNHHGRVPVFAAATTSAVLSIPLQGFTMNGVYFAFLRIFEGVSMASFVSVPILLGDISSPKNRGGTFSFNQLGYYAGQSVGPLCGGLLAAKLGVRAVFFCTAPLLGLSAVLAWLLPETLPKHRRSDAGYCDQVRESAECLAEALSAPQMHFALLIQFVQAVSNLAMVHVIIPQFGITRLHMGALGLGAMYSAGSVAKLLCAVPAGALCDRLGRKSGVVAGMTVAAGAALAMPLCRTGMHVILAYVPFSVGNSLASVAFSVFFADINDHDMRVRGQSLALQRNCMDVAEIVGGPVLGALAAFFGNQFFLVQSGVVLSAAISFGCLATEAVDSRRA